MMLFVFLALFLPFVGLSSVFVVYFCLFCYSTASSHMLPTAVYDAKQVGLSKLELEYIPKAIGQQLLMGSECAVCLEDIAADEPARMMPCCNHGFHLLCAEKWLSEHPVCPICRAKLLPQIPLLSQNPPAAIDSSAAPLPPLPGDVV